MSVFLDIEHALDEVFKKSTLTAYQKTLILKKLGKINVYTAGQLLSFIPVEYEHRNTVTPLQHASQDNKVLVKIIVLSHKEIILPRRGRVLQIVVSDTDDNNDAINDAINTSGTGFKTAELHCYGRAFLSRMMPVNSQHYVWGKFSKRRGKIITSAFEVVTLSHRKNQIVARYRLPVGSITANMFSLAMRAVLENTSISNLHEYHQSYTSKKNIFKTDITRAKACYMLHFPQSDEEIKLARLYFAIDEMLLFQLSVQYAQKNAKVKALKNNSKSIIHTSEKTTQNYVLKHNQNILEFEKNGNKAKIKKNNYLHALIQSLPFILTKGQRQIIKEIILDIQNGMSTGMPMRRLLQGDVGSGKTIVALCSAMYVLQNSMLENKQKNQVCFIVPSEALALQHYRNIKKLCQPLGFEIVYLTGAIKTSVKKQVLADIKSGDADIIIGTHAVYSKPVQYYNLLYTIIDEQHRFGIAQRGELLQKSEFMHALLMSATPIPRSLALTLYSGINISTLKDRPAMKKDVTTRIVLQKKIPQVYVRVKQRLDDGQQAFFVFPQIEQNAGQNTEQNVSTNLLSAQEMFPKITKTLTPHTTALLHSKIPENERIHILESFAKGEIKALVCTTLIEVGIDVHNANVMCIFDAQRFGLATLHQLRGRVGRGEVKGEAILIYKEPLSDVARDRLKAIYENNDGFVIAEKDLILRGPGDINYMGSRQSGSLLFQFTDLALDIDILQMFNTCAKKILDTDPELKKQSHLRLKYYLKGYVSGVQGFI